MPDRRPRLRRVAYIAAVMMSCALFVFALTGIATTQGRIKPNGDAATAVKHLQQVEGHPGPCHRQQQPTVAPQREV